MGARLVAPPESLHERAEGHRVVAARAKAVGCGGPHLTRMARVRLHRSGEQGSDEQVPTRVQGRNSGGGLRARLDTDVCRSCVLFEVVIGPERCLRGWKER